jgi:hypothetical protein
LGEKEMAFFSSSAFWFIEGLLFCIVLAGISAWAKDKEVDMPLWKWLVAAGWIIFASLSIAVTTTFIGEGETAAASRIGIAISVPVIISAYLVLRILGFTGRKNRNT